IVKEGKMEEFGRTIFLSDPTYSRMERNAHITERTFSKCIAALKVTIMRFDNALSGLDPEEWEVRESLLENRHAVHQLIDNLLRLKRKTQHAGVYLERHKN